MPILGLGAGAAGAVNTNPTWPYPTNAYLIDLKTSVRLDFQFMPEDVRDSKSAVYQDYPIVGRSVPYKAYSYSQSRMISLTLKFWVSPIQGDDKPDPREVARRVRWLRSLVYADYSRGIDPPHPVLLRLGLAVAMESVVVSYARTPSTTWIGDKLPGGDPAGAGGSGFPQLPHGETVQLTLAEVRSIPLSYDEVQGGDDYNPGEGDAPDAGLGATPGSEGG